jgi:hypothetical protein
MKGTTTGADLYKEDTKELQSLDIPVQRPAGLETDGAPRMVARNSGVSSLTKNDVKNTTIQFG